MRVFMTGATGFIGFHVVKELLFAGHDVLGMARSDKGAQVLAAIGALVHRGTLEDLDSLRRGARESDAVIHLGFNHDFSKFSENCEIDRHAIEALGEALRDTDKPFIVASGIGGLDGQGRIPTEEDNISPYFPFPRVSEQTALSLLSKGVRASVMRLPQVHDTVRQGLLSYFIAIAREKKVSPYVGDGQRRFSAAHVSDVAKLYRLVLEKNEPGARYHAIGEEGVSIREIAEAIGRGLKVPVVSLPPEEAGKHFGWMGQFVAADLIASSEWTRKKLNWNPTGPGLIEDLDRMNFSLLPIH